jgi:hypothetical protein
VFCDDREPLPVDEAVTLAADLLNVLAARIGDPDAVDALLRHWTTTLGARRLGQVSVAAVRTTFVDCLTRVSELPPNGTAFTAPEGAAMTDDHKEIRP